MSKFIFVCCGVMSGIGKGTGEHGSGAQAALRQRANACGSVINCASLDYLLLGGD